MLARALANRIGYTTPTTPGVWSLTSGPSALNLATSKYTVFAQAEDRYDVIDDSFDLALEVQ
jgi:hypothetical protein